MQSGEKRHRITLEILESSTTALLQKIAFPDGMRGLDLGCGTGEVTFQLARRTGREGKIIGMDQDADNIRNAQEKQRKAEIRNVQFVWKNITEWQETERYDLVYSRFLLNRLKQPLTTLEGIYKSLKSGGMAVVEDMDCSNYYCHPACYAFDRYLELFTEAKKRQGTDPFIGHKLWSQLRAAGFQKIQVQMVPATFLRLQNKAFASLTLEYIAGMLLFERMVSDAELEVLLQELRAFEQRADTLITAPGIYQAWGYK